MDNLTSPDQSDSELAFESALRPKSLEEFVGQNKVREQISLIIEAAKIQSRTADHILLAGPPGLGKTTLAMIVAHESGAPLRLTSGPTIQHAGDLAAVLSSLAPGEVLFIDEIHRMARAAEEMLYLAMEDFRVDVMVGKGPGATSIPLELAPFTLVGATTRSGMLPNPLRDRFGFTAHLEFYEVDDLREVAPTSYEIICCLRDYDATHRVTNENGWLIARAKLCNNFVSVHLHRYGFFGSRVITLSRKIDDLDGMTLCPQSVEKCVTPHV